jgi:hypothetical protein
MGDPSSGLRLPSTDSAQPDIGRTASSGRQSDLTYRPYPIARQPRGLVASFGCAFAGLWHVVKTQRNMRIHLAIAAMAVAAGLGLGLD